MSRDDGFLNVDLEVGARSRAQLAPLVDAVQGKLFELFRGRIGGLYRAHYQTKGVMRNASSTIHELAAAIEAVNASGRRAWDAAKMRDFNIGVELTRGVRMVELAITPDAICRVAALGGRIAFTTYQVSEWRQPKPRSTHARERRPPVAPRRQSARSSNA
jgi:hypothetical protein